MIRKILASMAICSIFMVGCGGGDTAKKDAGKTGGAAPAAKPADKPAEKK